jgi:hypothetical protein
MLHGTAYVVGVCHLRCGGDWFLNHVGTHRGVVMNIDIDLPLSGRFKDTDGLK